MRLRQFLTLATIALVSVLVCGTAVAATVVNDVRLWRAPDYTRVVLDLSAPVEHNVIRLENPQRIVIDLENSRIEADTGALDFAGSPVLRLRSGVKNKRDLRIVLDLAKAVKPSSFLLKSNKKSGDRLVIDLYDEGKRKRKQVLKYDNNSGRRDIVIAIDAGHGGEDPGASGPNRLREKKVVLAIARELNSLFKREPGYKPVLIRSGDYFVPLQKRRQLAKVAQADLMVSIHADAFSDSRVNGTSVYVLSRRGASSATAKFLASEANSSDLIGGVRLADKSDELVSILTDLAMTSSLDMSFQVGGKVIKSMGGVSRLHSKKVEQANFSVLRSPYIPSLLVETGFISNPAEARKLNTKRYQQKMAKAIFSGVSQHFSYNPPPDTLLAWQRKSRQQAMEYTIARGDTLSAIALRFQVSIAAIRRKNAMASNMVKIGQRIIIPAS